MLPQFTKGGKRESAMNETTPQIPDWDSVDWSQTNIEISVELGCPISVVSFYRKALGKSHRSLQEIDWESVDWNKTNQQICFDHGIAIKKVALARVILGKPRTKPGADYNKVVSEEMIASVNWKTSRDAHIARQWHVSRERVRQIRLERNLPTCEVNFIESRAVAIDKWLIENKESISGKVSLEVAKLCPVDSPIQDKFRVMKRSNIPFLWNGHHSPSEYLPINWDLPNSVIEAIWNRCVNWAASNRYRNQKAEGKWRLRGPLPARETLAKIPDLKQACLDEIENAKKVGVSPDYKRLEHFGLP